MVLLYGDGYPCSYRYLAGIPSFIAAYREEGTWYLDWVKVIAITLPSLLILSLPHLYFSSPLGKFIPLSASVILSDTNRIISGFVFGFTLLSFPENELVVILMKRGDVSVPRQA